MIGEVEYAHKKRRGFTRPALTWGLVAAQVAIYWSTTDGELSTQAVNTILYEGATAVTWWFGSRPAKSTR